MSKKRALENVELAWDWVKPGRSDSDFVTEHNRVAIGFLIDAIRELAKEEPETATPEQFYDKVHLPTLHEMCVVLEYPDNPAKALETLRELVKRIKEARESLALIPR